MNEVHFRIKKLSIQFMVVTKLFSLHQNITKSSELLHDISRKKHKLVYSNRTCIIKKLNEN